MLAVSSLSTISSLISIALSDDSILDEEYSLILLEFETFTRLREDLRKKSKMSLGKIGPIETEANELLRRSKVGVRLEFVIKTMVKSMFKILFKTLFETLFKTMFKTVVKPCSRPSSRSCSKPCSKQCSKPYSTKINNS